MHAVNLLIQLNALHEPSGSIRRILDNGLIPTIPNVTRFELSYMDVAFYR
jgi:hypothetical protein